MEHLKFKNFDIHTKKEDDAGNLIIEGYAAIFGNIDSYGDRIQKGAFEKTLIERKGRIPFCYQHDIWNPIGKPMEIKEDDKGLFVRAMISAAEDDIQTKIREEILKEMSIGYRTLNSTTAMQDGVPVNELTEVKLVEISIVTIAANPLATIESYKTEAEKKDFISGQFDRLIALIRNENINFEVERLKAMVIAGYTTKEQPQPEPEPQPVTKAEASEALLGKKEIFKNALNFRTN